MDDDAARKVQDPHFGEPPSTPDPVCDGVVDKKGPEQDENDIGAEFHALGDGSADERRCDDGEHALKHDEGIGGDSPCQRIRCRAYQQELAEVADPGIAGAEGERIACQNPEDSDNCKGRKGMHMRAQHVFGLHHPTIEEGEAREHQHDKRGRDEDPYGVRGVGPGRVGCQRRSTAKQCEGRQKTGNTHFGDPFSGNGMQPAC